MDSLYSRTHLVNDVQPLGLLMPFRRCAVGPNSAAVGT